MSGFHGRLCRMIEDGDYADFSTYSADGGPGCHKQANSGAGMAHMHHFYNMASVRQQGAADDERDEYAQYYWPRVQSELTRVAQIEETRGSARYW